MVRYLRKGKGKVYTPRDARTVLSSCLVTWKATRPHREQPFFYDDHESQSPSDRALFVSLRTSRMCHRISSEFIVEPYNPYLFSRKFCYTPTIPGLSGSTRETVNLPTGLKFWRKGILSRARQKSSGSSKRKHSSSSIVENRDPKHARGAWKDTSSSRGSRVASPVRKSPEAATPSLVPDDIIRDQVVEVSSFFSGQEHTELVDTGESPECLAIKVAESHPPASPPWKSPEMVLKEEESAMETFGILSATGLDDVADLRGKLQNFFQEARKLNAAPIAVLPVDASETLQKLSLLRVSLEEQTSRNQCVVQKIEKQELEVAELESRIGDLRVQIQEQECVISQLDLETADTSV
ncbi:hypothetical protein LIER_15246 [Lithospermum erythrorhizon]|uniref:Uncharacterized protein n=1 Tax=Lithospermum erythrorhizon TaxID=34254 RepID=A0AAV3Q3Q7_LITER